MYYHPTPRMPTESAVKKSQTDECGLSAAQTTFLKGFSLFLIVKIIL